MESDDEKEKDDKDVLQSLATGSPVASTSTFQMAALSPTDVSAGVMATINTSLEKGQKNEDHQKEEQGHGDPVIASRATNALQTSKGRGRRRRRKSERRRGRGSDSERRGRRTRSRTVRAFNRIFHLPSLQ